MKKLLTIVLTLILCLSLFLPIAHADVIWEPNSSFYEKHREECEYIDKSYIAFNGAQGYRAPGDKEPIWVCDDSEQTLYISFAYTAKDGTQWGAADVTMDEERVSVWIDLGTMAPVYDSRDFFADHANEIYAYTDELDDLPDSVSELVYLWNYPGALDSYTFTLDEFEDSYGSNVYTDEFGGVWVYFPYIFGADGWIYATDPFNSEPISLPVALIDVPTESTPVDVTLPDDESTETETPASTAAPTPAASTAAPEDVSETDSAQTGSSVGFSRLLFIIGAVFFLVLASVVLIVVLYACKKK